MPTVTGEIRFASKNPDLNDATAYVWISDDSRAGAPARPVAEHKIQSLSKEPISFKLAVPTPIDEKARYNVHVRVNTHGDRNDIQSGDYITMQTYPVLTHGFPNHVQVEVKQV